MDRSLLLLDLSWSGTYMALLLGGMAGFVGGMAGAGIMLPLERRSIGPMSSLSPGLLSLGAMWAAL